MSATEDGELVEQIARRTAELLGLSGAPKLVGAEAVAAQLGVPVSWVRASARRGEIPHVRLGHYVRFDPSEVDSWWRARADRERTI